MNRAPLLAGGQGRTFASVRDDALCIGLLFGLALLDAVLAVLRYFFPL